MERFLYISEFYNCFHILIKYINHCIKYYSLIFSYGISYLLEISFYYQYFVNFFLHFHLNCIYCYCLSNDALVFVHPFFVELWLLIFLYLVWLYFLNHHLIYTDRYSLKIKYDFVGFDSPSFRMTFYSWKFIFGFEWVGLFFCCSV